MTELQQAALWANVADKMLNHANEAKAINAKNAEELLAALGVFAATVSAAYQDAIK